MKPLFTFSAFLIFWRYHGWIPFVFSQYHKDWQFFCICTGDSCIGALSNFSSDYCKPFPWLLSLFSFMLYDSPGRLTWLLWNHFVLLFKSFCVTSLDYLIMLFPISHIFPITPNALHSFLLFLSCWCCSHFYFASHISHLTLLSKMYV